MDCPVDGETLLITERQGIEIDYCPRCRGVWLDRGELDKMIDRSSDIGGLAPRERRRTDDDDDDDDRPRGSYDRSGREDERTGTRKKRRGSFLSELFEFGE